MYNIFKKSFQILKNNMVFIQPMLLFQLVLTVFMAVSINRIQLPLPKTIMWTSVVLLFTACLSGWLYINKYAVLSYNEKDTQEEITVKTLQNLKKFFEGVGSDFVRTLFAGVLSLLLYCALFFILFKFCISHFGIPSFINELASVYQNGTKEQLMQFVANINNSDKIAFLNWVIAVNVAFSVLNFFVLLYFAVMNFERKNFIVSFFSALKFFILNIFEAVGIIIFIFILYLLINIISVFLSTNAFLFALLIIIMTAYFNYYVLLVFCFYYEKTTLNRNNGTELVGENEVGGGTGENA